MNKVSRPKGFPQNTKRMKGKTMKKMKGRPELQDVAHKVRGGAKKRAFKSGGKTLMTY
jgi:hypothetical protein